MQQEEWLEGSLTWAQLLVTLEGCHKVIFSLSTFWRRTFRRLSEHWPGSSWNLAYRWFEALPRYSLASQCCHQINSWEDQLRGEESFILAHYFRALSPLSLEQKFGQWKPTKNHRNRVCCPFQLVFYSVWFPSSWNVTSHICGTFFILQLIKNILTSTPRDVPHWSPEWI